MRCQKIGGSYKRGKVHASVFKSSRYVFPRDGVCMMWVIAPGMGRYGAASAEGKGVVRGREAGRMGSGKRYDFYETANFEMESCQAGLGRTSRYQANGL